MSGWSSRTARARRPTSTWAEGPAKQIRTRPLRPSWAADTAARASSAARYETALRYTLDREQFGKPLAGFQLTQRKLADLVVDVNRAALVALQISRLKDAGRLHHHQVSFGKMANVRTALEVARTARTMLGGSGITLEYPVFRHMANLETVLTYEGTDEMHALSIGQAVTGIPAFR